MLEKIQPHDGIAQHIKTTQLSSELYIHVAIHHVAKINRKLLKSVCVCVCVLFQHMYACNCDAIRLQICDQIHKVSCKLCQLL